GVVESPRQEPRVEPQRILVVARRGGQVAACELERAERGARLRPVRGELESLAVLVRRAREIARSGNRQQVAKARECERGLDAHAAYGVAEQRPRLQARGRG